MNCCCNLAQNIWYHNDNDFLVQLCCVFCWTVSSAISCWFFVVFLWHNFSFLAFLCFLVLFLCGMCVITVLELSSFAFFVYLGVPSLLFSTHCFVLFFFSPLFLSLIETLLTMSMKKIDLFFSVVVRCC